MHKTPMEANIEILLLTTPFGLMTNLNLMSEDTLCMNIIMKSHVKQVR